MLTFCIRKRDAHFGFCRGSRNTWPGGVAPQSSQWMDYSLLGEKTKKGQIKHTEHLTNETSRWKISLLDSITPRVVREVETEAEHQ